jgi:hypothetical protein
MSTTLGMQQLGIAFIAKLSLCTLMTCVHGTNDNFLLN